MKKLAILPLILLFFLGCATAEKRSLDTAINVNEKYQELRSKYLDTYEPGSPEVKKYLEENIAPKLNEARESIIEYNSIVLDGTTSKKAQRELIIKLLIRIERLMEEI